MTAYLYPRGNSVPDSEKTLISDEIQAQSFYLFIGIPFDEIDKLPFEEWSKGCNMHDTHDIICDEKGDKKKNEK
jgi:hypothetical protein